jgi:hypothetical protein
MKKEEYLRINNRETNKIMVGEELLKKSRQGNTHIHLILGSSNLKEIRAKIW